MTGRINTKRNGRVWLAIAVAAIAASAVAVSAAYADLSQTPITSTAKVHEYHPVASDTYLGWERNRAGHRKHLDVYAKPFGGAAFKVNADGTRADLGGIDGTTLIYSQSKRIGSPGNLHLMDLVTRTRTKLPAVVNTRGDEYWASISGDWIEFQRKTRRFKREYIYNTSTHELRKLEEVPANGYIESGQLNGNYVTWMKCGRVTCKVRLYDIAAQTRTVLPVASNRYQFGAAVTADGTIYYGEASLRARCGRAVRLIKRPLGGPSTTLVSFNRGTDFFSTYAYTNTGGTDLYYAKLHCATSATDIYRVTSP
jgi:hypothetical protein